MLAIIIKGVSRFFSMSVIINVNSDNVSLYVYVWECYIFYSIEWCFLIVLRMLNVCAYMCVIVLHQAHNEYVMYVHVQVHVCAHRCVWILADLIFGDAATDTHLICQCALCMRISVHVCKCARRPRGTVGVAHMKRRACRYNLRARRW